MPKSTVVAGAVAAVVAAPAYWFYVRSIKRGETDPNTASWFIWTIVGWIIFSSYVVTGARDSALTTFVYAVGPPIVLWYAYKYETINIGRKEKIFLLASGLSLVLWAVFRNSLIALYINIIVDAGAVGPTLVDAWTEPEKEDKTTWWISTVAASINLLAVEHWVNPRLWVRPATWATKEFAVCFYPMVIVGMCGSVLALTLIRPDSRRKEGQWTL